MCSQDAAVLLGTERLLWAQFILCAATEKQRGGYLTHVLKDLPHGGPFCMYTSSRRCKGVEGMCSQDAAVLLGNTRLFLPHLLLWAATQKNHVGGTLLTYLKSGLRVDHFACKHLQHAT
jgi:hypothetical protein